jgi:rhodanese-related sulfurtransferase
MYNIEEVNVTTLAEWLAQGEAISLVDVRSPAEMNRGMIENAAPLPMHLVPLRPPEPKSGERLVIYCRSGARSAQVCAFLGQRGMTDIYNLRGGIIAWQSAGLPLVRPESDVLAG